MSEVGQTRYGRKEMKSPAESGAWYFGLTQFFGQFRNCVEEIRDEAVVCDLENGGFFVFVDGDDDFPVFHTGLMLDGCPLADGNV